MGPSLLITTLVDITNLATEKHSVTLLLRVLVLPMLEDAWNSGNGIITTALCLFQVQEILLQLRKLQT